MTDRGRKASIHINIAEVSDIEAIAQDVYERAVRLLEDHGIGIQDKEILDRISTCGGISVKKGRVFAERSLIEKYAPSPNERRRSRSAEKSEETGWFHIDVDGSAFILRGEKQVEQDSYRLRNGGFSHAVFDWNAKKVREATSQDLIDLLRLCDSYNLAGHVPVTPQDVHPRLRNIAVHRYAFEYSRHICSHVSYGIEEAKVVYDLYNVMSGTIFPIPVTVVSPLKISRDNLKVLLYFNDKGLINNRVRVIPIGYGLPGISHPLSITGGQMLGMAELIGTFIILKSINPGMEISEVVGLSGFNPVDYRHCCIALGAPPSIIFYILNHMLAFAYMGGDFREYMHLPEVGLWTGACEPDEQAACEKTSSALMLASLGIKKFGRLGNLCTDDVFSAEQLVMDLEMLSHIKETTESFSLTPILTNMEGVLDSINSVIKTGGNFMTEPMTIQNYRKIFRPTEMFEHMKLNSYLQEGRGGVTEKAHSCVLQRVKSHEYRADAAVTKKLDAIYKRAEKSLVT